LGVFKPDYTEKRPEEEVSNDQKRIEKKGETARNRFRFTPFAWKTW